MILFYPLPEKIKKKGLPATGKALETTVGCLKA